MTFSSINSNLNTILTVIFHRYRTIQITIYCVGIYMKMPHMKKSVLPEHKKQLNEIASYLKELRFSENRTQAEVCAELDLHENSLSRIENGKNMNLTTLFRLCDYYDIPIDSVFTWHR